MSNNAKPSFNEQLLAYFQQQPPEQVAQWLVQSIAADKSLKKQWQVKLLLSSGKPNDFKKLLTQALPKKELLHTRHLWNKVGLYFDEAVILFELAFEHLDASDSPLTNEQQFTWLMQAFERLNLVLETIDDSGGYRLELVDLLGARLVRAFHLLDWPIDQKASWLQEHQFKYDVFPYIPEEFELSEDLLTEFTSLASKQTQQSTPDNLSMALLERLQSKNKR